MFRRVFLAVVTGFIVVSLTALAQDAPAAQTQSGSGTGSPGETNTQAQDTGSKNAGATQAKRSNSKKGHLFGRKKSKEPVNPIADLGSKQPDKVLYDRAMDALKQHKYDVARLSLQTLINTYPDSEYVARAKLAIGDSWYEEGGTAAMAQAESEYKDFITFFPNMPEAAEAQMKVGDIHFRQMEKADRDPTHARRAEEEYRQLILQFPDSPLVPQAKEHLLEVQEVLARREYMIGHFYYLRESYPAAIARLKSLTDTYPLYSGADEALFELGSSYEVEVSNVRRTSALPEVAKGALIKQYTDDAVAAYSRILTRYPLESRAADAKKRLEAMNQPIPQATPEAIAQDKAEIASRGSVGTFGKLMENFHKGPDISEATKAGEPTLVDPKQASAPDIIRAADVSIFKTIQEAQAGSHVTVEQVKGGSATPENAPVPHSDATPGTNSSAGDNASAAAPSSSDSAAPGPAAGTEMRNDLAPPPSSGTGPLPPPSQVNDLANAPSDGNTAQPAATNSNQQTAPKADTQSESSSKKKKKHHLLLF